MIQLKIKSLWFHEIFSHFLPWLITRQFEVWKHWISLWILLVKLGEVASQFRLYLLARFCQSSSFELRTFFKQYGVFSSEIFMEIFRQNTSQTNECSQLIQVQILRQFHVIFCNFLPREKCATDLFWFTDYRSNSGVKKVTKKFRIFANLEKLNLKYLFCPPVFVNITLSISSTFIKDQFSYKAPYLLKLTNRDIKTSNALKKSLKRAFVGRHFDNQILSNGKTKSKTDFRSLISRLLTIFKCILAPLCENRYFQPMFTVWDSMEFI